MPRCLVALGGNLGDVESTFEQALSRLDELPHCSLVAQSRVYRTPAVGDAAGPPFLNAAAELRTDRAPLQLLDELQSIERMFGRERSTHWGPRTLDLDVIAYREEIVHDPRLEVPHPACWYRRFVLDPIAEIAPNWLHPVKQRTFRELRFRLMKRPLHVALAGGDESECKEMLKALTSLFSGVELDIWSGEIDPLPTLVVWWPTTPSQSALAADFQSLPELPRLKLEPGPEHTLAAIRDVIRSALGSD